MDHTSLLDVKFQLYQAYDSHVYEYSGSGITPSHQEFVSISLNYILQINFNNLLIWLIVIYKLNSNFIKCQYHKHSRRNMLIKFICAIIFSKCLNFVNAKEDVNEVFNKCVSFKNSYYCPDNLIKFIKKIKTESTNNSAVIQKMNDSLVKQPEEDVANLMRLLKQLFFPVSTSKEAASSVVTSTQKRSLEKLPKSETSFKGIIYSYLVNFNIKYTRLL